MKPELFELESDPNYQIRVRLDFPQMNAIG